jgi:hypothetical protein
VSFFAARGLWVTGNDQVVKTLRLGASTFSDVLSFEWKSVVSEVSGDFAYTVAIERCPASHEAT